MACHIKKKRNILRILKVCRNLFRDGSVVLRRECVDNSMKKKFAYNSLTALLLQFVTVVCGLILPRLFITTFGSETNGLINSICQFLSVISLLTMGMTSVVTSNLYEPIAKNNQSRINEILSAASRFYRKIAYVLICYVIFLIIFFPIIVNVNFGWGYISFLIIALSVDFFATYFFGSVDKIWITASQKIYIYHLLQMAAVLINTIAGVILIKLGFSVQVVKLTAALIFLTRPFILRLYINKNYTIKRNVHYEGNPIKQKYNGIAQHLAFTLLNNTDVVVLTLMSTLENVSVYAVYHIVANGLKNIVEALSSGMEAAFGNLWANDEIERLRKYFESIEWGVHIGAVFLFGCASILGTPFVLVYTRGVTDANYNQPIFCGFLMLAFAFLCIRTPYNAMILAAGHLKQTQHFHVIGAFINVVLSVIMVHKWGLNGVALGTIAAAIFYTLWMSIYVSRNFLLHNFRNFIKRSLIDCLIVIISYVISKQCIYHVNNYMEWIVVSVKICIIWGTVIFVIDCIFERRIIKIVQNLAEYVYSRRAK